MANGTIAEIHTEIINRTIINSTIVIRQMVEENKGIYECSASNDAQTARRVYTLALKSIYSNDFCFSFLNCYYNSHTAFSKCLPVFLDAVNYCQLKPPVCDLTLKDWKDYPRWRRYNDMQGLNFQQEYFLAKS